MFTGSRSNVIHLRASLAVSRLFLCLQSETNNTVSISERRKLGRIYFYLLVYTCAITVIVNFITTHIHTFFLFFRTIFRDHFSFLTHRLSLLQLRLSTNFLFCNAFHIMVICQSYNFHSHLFVFVFSTFFFFGPPYFCFAFFYFFFFLITVFLYIFTFFSFHMPGVSELHALIHLFILFSIF